MLMFITHLACNMYNIYGEYTINLKIITLHSWIKLFFCSQNRFHLFFFESSLTFRLGMFDLFLIVN